MTFRPNRTLARDLERRQGRQLTEALKDAAEPARERADQFARGMSPSPIMPKAGSAGGKLVVTEVAGRQVTIVLRGHGAHLAEFGSRNNPAYAPLRRGVLAARLKLRQH